MASGHDTAAPPSSVMNSRRGRGFASPFPALAYLMVSWGCQLGRFAMWDAVEVVCFVWTVMILMYAVIAVALIIGRWAFNRIRQAQLIQSFVRYARPHRTELQGNAVLAVFRALREAHPCRAEHGD